MALRPDDHEWTGFTSEQAKLLNRFDFYGNNGWSRNPQSEVVLPNLLKQLHDAGLPLDEVKEAMASIGYGKEALHELDRWESKRTTGRFGR